MKRLFTWIVERISGDEDLPAPRSRPPAARITPRPAQTLKSPPRTQATRNDAPGIKGRIEDGGPGKNVLVRNKYLREDTGTHDTLQIVDESLSQSSDEGGIDPYNTGRFDRSKSWDTFRFRK